MNSYKNPLSLSCNLALRFLKYCLNIVRENFAKRVARSSWIGCARGLSVDDQSWNAPCTHAHETDGPRDTYSRRFVRQETCARRNFVMQPVGRRTTRCTVCDSNYAPQAEERIADRWGGGYALSPARGETREANASGMGGAPWSNSRWH